MYILSATWLPHGQLAPLFRGQPTLRLILVRPKGHLKPCNEVGSQSLSMYLTGFELGILVNGNATL